MALHASWIHGNAAQLERVNSPSAGSRQTVRRSFGPTDNGRLFDGDIVDLGGWGGIACLRIGWAARFVAFDHGSGDYPKSGSFWCHYPVPTPVIEDGVRAKAKTVLLNYESTNVRAVGPAAVHVWDGNRRIFANDRPEVSGDRFNGGISGATSDAAAHPDLNRLWRGNLGGREIFFGMVICINIRAQEARNEYMEIRSVGIDFEV